MDLFNPDIFLPKEWLVKVDAHTSTPYLLKFHSAPMEPSCCVMVTDTRRTWTEALSSRQFARRWRDCNKRIDSPPLDIDDEEAWRTRSLDLLSSAHTLGGMPELSFEVIDTGFGDLTFQLECNAFKWRWETIFIGHRVSADILSKHLIMPLISVNHLAFSSPDIVGDLSRTDLEKSVDKIARTARRTVDTHIKNALSKPRLATTIRRITAAFNFVPDPPNISTEANPPVLLPLEPTSKLKLSPESDKTTRHLTPEVDDHRTLSPSPEREHIVPSQASKHINTAADSDSATEPEEDPQPLEPGPGPSADRQPDIRMRSPLPLRKARTIRSRGVSKAPSSDTDSSPVRPIKKPKSRVPSSDGSEEKQKKTAASRPRLRQPIRRGSKRF